MIAKTLELPSTPTLLKDLIVPVGAMNQRYSVCMSVLENSELHISTSEAPGENSIHIAGDKINWTLDNLWDGMCLSGAGFISVEIIFGG